jgi:hypothetical protein
VVQVQTPTQQRFQLSDYFSMPVMQPTVIPTPLRRPNNLANIQSRHHHIAATQCTSIYNKEVVDRMLQAFRFFEDKCIMCWMQKKDDHDEHISDSCRGVIGNRANDKDYEPFRKSFIQLPAGWCYFCLIHQVLKF